MKLVSALLFLMVTTDVNGAILDSLATAADDTVIQRFAVDLDGLEIPGLSRIDSVQHLLARPWYGRIDIWGFAAFWFAATGADGLRSEAGFEIKESSLFVEAQAWDDLSIFMEVQTTPPLSDQDQRIRTGELYGHFRNILGVPNAYLQGLKIGRIDIPFGEEYLSQDAVDNVLISNSAAYPWLWDEGFLLYGKIAGTGWLASVTDGFIGRGGDDDGEKALNLKLYGSPAADWFVSASAMRNGETAAGALLLGGSLLQPVGTIHASSAGTSPSSRIGAWLFQVDLQYGSMGRTVDLAAGRGLVDDDVDSFDRSLSWFSLQGHWETTRSLYFAARYSEIGTYDDERGYHFGGEFLTGGNEAYGYDATRLVRRSIGLGWRPNPMSTIKIETGSDRYEVIDRSAAEPSDDDRSFLAIETAIQF